MGSKLYVGKWPKRNIVIIGLACGLTTFLVAILVEVLFPDWPRSRRGGIVGGWVIFSLSVAPLTQRLFRRDAPDRSELRRVP